METLLEYVVKVLCNPALQVFFHHLFSRLFIAHQQIVQYRKQLQGDTRSVSMIIDSSLLLSWYVSRHLFKQKKDALQDRYASLIAVFLMGGS